VAGNNTNQTSAGYAYNYSGSSAHDATGVKNCIETTTCTQPQAFMTWKLCFQNSDANRTAEIDLINQPTGVNSELKFVNCS
jgi:hypothetical protein